MVVNCLDVCIIIDYYMAFFISHVISTRDAHISPRLLHPWEIWLVAFQIYHIYKIKYDFSSEIDVFWSDQFSLLMYHCLLPSSVTVNIYSVSVSGRLKTQVYGFYTIGGESAGGGLYWHWFLRTVLNASKELVCTTLLGRWFQWITVSTKKKMLVLLFLVVW